MRRVLPPDARFTHSDGATLWRPAAITRSGQGGASASLSGANCIAPPKRRNGVTLRQNARSATRFTTGESPSASAKPRHCDSIPALPSVSTQQESNAASKPEHMVEAECPFADQTVIAEQTTSGIAYHHITILAGLLPLGLREHLVETPQQ